jgi:DnaJ-class molecular chaperone
MYSPSEQKQKYTLSKQLLGQEQISPLDIDQLRELLKFHEWKYYVKNDPLLSDYEYDTLYKKLEAIEIEHPDLVRDENDLLYNLFISIPDSILGATVEIPTISSRVKVKIEKGTQSGRILRLKGKGLPDVNGYGQGDLLVKINIWIPKHISKEEQKTLEKLNQSENFSPKPSSQEKNLFKRVRNFFD